MGLSGTDLYRCGTAILHDIGKIGIPGAILNKPDRLTDEEFAVMAEHTGDRGAHHLAHRAPALDRAHREGGARALGRRRLSRRPRRRRDPLALAHPAGLRRLSRHGVGPARTARRWPTRRRLAELLDGEARPFDPRWWRRSSPRADAIERPSCKVPVRLSARLRPQCSPPCWSRTSWGPRGGRGRGVGDTGSTATSSTVTTPRCALLRRFTGAARIDTAGDGFLATFDGAARAVETRSRHRLASSRRSVSRSEQAVALGR